MLLWISVFNSTLISLLTFLKKSVSKWQGNFTKFSHDIRNFRLLEQAVVVLLYGKWSVILKIFFFFRKFIPNCKALPHNAVTYVKAYCSLYCQSLLLVRDANVAALVALSNVCYFQVHPPSISTITHEIVFSEEELVFMALLDICIWFY